MSEETLPGQANALVRRCVLTGDRAPKEDLIRLVLSPEGRLCVDIDAVLPGRGLWVKCDRDVLAAGTKTSQLLQAAARGFKTTPGSIKIGDDLASEVGELLRQRCLNAVGLERRAGRVVLGAEKVRAAANKGHITCLLLAADAGADALGKVQGLRLEGHVPIVRFFSRNELGLALGRENVVQAALTKVGKHSGLFRWIDRLALYSGQLSDETGLNDVN